MPDDLRERRVVTVLFSDLSGFTRLSESMDPEEVTDLVDALFRRLRPLIEGRGGTVDKFIGDAVMAVFGAPVAHADDPARAVAAALAMQGELAALNAEKGLGLRMRVGLNTGEVLWGGIGGDRATAIGDAVNVAQRMESSAVPGTVLASAATERLARNRFRFRPRGEVAVKGRQEPVVAFEVIGAAPGGGTTRETPLAGREDELRGLEEAVERGGAFIVLSGEAGVGKSRLAAELRRRFRDRHPGAWVACGRAEPGAGRPMAAFEEMALAEAGTLAQVAAVVARQCEGAEADPIERENDGLLVAHSLGHPVRGSRIETIEPARLEQEEQLAWTRWIGARLPALLCVEDLHEAGAPTRSLLAALARAHAGRGLSIVATARPGPAAPAGFETRAVADLPAGAAGRLAESVLGGPLTAEFAAFLLERTGGNPCYIEQLCRFLAEENLLTGPPFATEARSGLPAGLAGVLVARLDALPPDDKAAVKGASAVGRVFWQDLVARVLERDVAEALAEARRREMVALAERSQFEGDTELAFRHALLRDAAYSLLTRRERQRLHERAAALFEERIPAAGRPLRALAALQRDAAGDPPAAAAHWLRVAEEALAEHQLEEARAAASEAARLGAGPPAHLAASRACHLLARFDEAVAGARSAVSSPDPAVRAAAFLALSEALGERSEFDAAVEAANSALAEKPDRALACQLHLKLAHLRQCQGKFGTALLDVDQAEAILASWDDVSTATLPLRAGVLNRRAIIHRIRGDNDVALALLQRSLDLNRRAGHLPGLMLAYSEIGVICKRTGRFEEALAAFRELKECSRRSGARIAVARHLGNLGNLYYWLHRWDEAISSLGESLKILREAGSPGGISDCLINLGIVHLAMGKKEEAIAEQREALALSRTLGTRENTVLALGNLATGLRETGKPAEALDACEEARILAEADGNRPAISSLLDLNGKILTDLGRIPEALESLSRAIALKREIDHRPGLARSLANLAAARRAAGDPAGAAEARRESAALFVSTGDLEYACERFEELASDCTSAGDPKAGREALAAGLNAAKQGKLAVWEERFARALQAAAGD